MKDFPNKFLPNWKLQLFLYIILTEILLSLTITKTQMDNVLGVKLESSFNRQEPKISRLFQLGIFLTAKKRRKMETCTDPL